MTQQQRAPKKPPKPEPDDDLDEIVAWPPERRTGGEPLLVLQMTKNELRTTIMESIMLAVLICGAVAGAVLLALRG